ncbi:MAG: peptidoglycan editing factor PgeF [Defluviitaleaceae bacterium]|nr:peptidoglycan editing factor PgeF [Defluviitaleaceae bacterium]
MKINQHNDLHYVTLENIAATGFVNHAFSTRLGGVSRGKFAELNLGLARGDERERVMENYSRLAESVGFDWRNTIFSNQVHGIKVHRATIEDRGSGILRPSTVKDTDAFVTNAENVVLQTYHADCVPVFLADPVRRAVGLAHSGWMGTLREIARVTVERMAGEFGTGPADIIAGIGPSIGPNSFEVHADVADRFRDELPFSQEFITPVERAGDQKFLVNLWAINRRSLENAGVSPANIEEAGLCTYERPDMFYSHRLTGADRGTMAAFIEIKAR